MKFHIHHRTRYRYTQPLRSATQTLCLTPRSNSAQHVHAWTLNAPVTLQGQVDAWGNHSHLLSVGAGLRVIVCEAQGEIETLGQAVVMDSLGPDPHRYTLPSSLAAADARMVEALKRAGPLRAPQGVDDVLTLAHWVLAQVPYQRGLTHAHTTAAHAWQLGGGVCQDQAHVFIALCRHLGCPARYVSGYFHAPGAEALASHAWAQVCVDPVRRLWLGVDITHGCLVDERHVQLAVGPDYGVCAPVRGVRSGGGHENLQVSVTIHCLDMAPAVPASSTPTEHAGHFSFSS